MATGVSGAATQPVQQLAGPAIEPEPGPVIAHLKLELGLHVLEMQLTLLHVPTTYRVQSVS